MLLEASGHSPSCVVVFSVIQDSLETSGHSIHQRGLQDSCTPWIAERGAARRDCWFYKLLWVEPVQQPLPYGSTQSNNVEPGDKLVL